MTTETASAPESRQRLTMHLVCAGAAEAIAFYGRAFGATETMRLPAPDGSIMHAAIDIEGATVMLTDENPSWNKSPATLGGTPVTLNLQVADADAAAARAVAAGARTVMPVALQFWGDRYGVVEDPFGHRWALLTPQGEPKTEAELRQAAAAFMQTCQPEEREDAR